MNKKIFILSTFLIFLLACEKLSYFTQKFSLTKKAIASVQLLPTQGNHATGILTFYRTHDFVIIEGEIQSLTPGFHGIHIHEIGDCSANAQNAGGHYNPTEQRHGGLSSPSHHMGDIGNVFADSSGYAKVHITIEDPLRIDEHIQIEYENETGETYHLGSLTQAIGKALILHEKRDDLQTNPEGNSGIRIACGIIKSYS